jgi:hypothetical protein
VAVALLVGGCVFQVAGVLTVVLEVRATRRRVENYRHRGITARPGTARGSFTALPATVETEPTPLEERVKRLEELVRSVRDTVATMPQEIMSQVREEISDSDQRMTATIRDQTEPLAALIVDELDSGRRTRAVRVGLVIVGIVLTMIGSMAANDRDLGEIDFDTLVNDFAGRLAYLQSQPFPPAGMLDKLTLGRLRLDFSEDRQLRGDIHDDEKIDALVAGAYLPDRWTDESLVASGGFCAPSAPDYDIPQISGTQRPVADYLPSVQMPRGSVSVIQPPRLIDIVSSASQGAGSAVSVWTNTIDTTPGGTTKPKQALSCPPPRTVTAQAIVERVRIGNFGNMAFPENVRVFLANVASAWARRAESELLRQIDSDPAVTSVTTTQVLGVNADFWGYLSRAAAAIRSHQRMPRNAKLRLLLPAWFIDLARADLSHVHAGDGLERWTQDPEAFVRAAAAASNVNLTFYEDSANMTSGNAANQLFTPQAGGDLENWPPTSGGVTNSRVISYLFPEGSFARGDAGTLDLGVVRDSTLNDTNDFEMFSESLEVVVPKVIEAYKWTATVCESGTGSSDSSASGYCTAS